MARFAFVGPSYRSQSVNADCQMTMNLYVESVESGQGKGPLALYCTPGLNQLYNLGSAGVRGIITAQGRTFCVAGTTLWELLASTAAPNKINRGNIVSDGQAVSMASGPTQVLIASAGNLYVFNLPTNVLALLPPFNAGTGLGLLGPVSQVVYADGFFFALIQNSNQIQASNPLDGSTWQGVSATQVSVFTDNVSAIYADHRLLWVFGPNNTQPYFDSGNFPFPYDVIQGGFIEQGIAAPFSVAKLDNSIFWLGEDARGSGIVWRANGYQPVRISTHAQEYVFSTYPTIADAVCYAYQDQGHTFYVMNFPTAQKTWVYDCATQMWHERGFWNSQAGIFTQHRAGFHTFNFGMHLVGDPTTGAVYQQSINLLSDFGNPIKRIRRAPHISDEQKFIFHTKIQVDVETGLGPNPPFPGSAQPTMIPMLDAAGGLRSFQIGDGGVVEAPLNAQGNPLTAGTIFMNDATNVTSWQITINQWGGIQPVAVTFNPNYPQAMNFVSTSGLQQWRLELTYGVGSVDLTTIPLGLIGRGPVMTLRWSNDGGHTWSNPYDRDCGQAGAYNARVYWQRLGRSRDRVYEISMTDPIPWRIIDAYLYTDPEDRQPVSRYASELRKRA